MRDPLADSVRSVSVTNYEREKRRQQLREVEGYLELVMSSLQQFPSVSDASNRLLQRGLNMLERLDAEGGECEELLCLRGESLRMLQRHHEAIAAFQEAVEWNSDNVSIWLALGWCQKRIGRLDLAIQSLEEAQSLAPDQAIIYYNLACYWSLGGNVTLALAYLTRAFDIDPGYRDLVPREADFDPIRRHAGFVELMSVIV